MFSSVIYGSITASNDAELPASHRTSALDVQLIS